MTSINIAKDGSVPGNFEDYAAHRIYWGTKRGEVTDEVKLIDHKNGTYTKTTTTKDPNVISWCETLLEKVGTVTVVEKITLANNRLTVVLTSPDVTASLLKITDTFVCWQEGANVKYKWMVTGVSHIPAEFENVVSGVYTNSRVKVFDEGIRQTASSHSAAAEDYPQ